MSEHTVTRLPERILSKTADVKLLGDILAEFNPDDYAKATTKYRKPSYQRGLNKSTVSESLVNKFFLTLIPIFETQELLFFLAI